MNQGEDFHPEVEKDIKDIDDELVYENERKKAYESLLRKYEALQEEGKVKFLAKVSRLIEDYKGKGGTRLCGQVKGYQEFLDHLMMEGRENL